MDNREMMERAFIGAGVMDYFVTKDGKVKNTLLWDALVEQATIGRIEIIHIPPSDGFEALTAIATCHQTIYLDGLHGTQGKAIAIIVPDCASNEVSRTDNAGAEEEDGKSINS